MNTKRVVQWIVVGVAIALIVFAYIKLSQPTSIKGNTLDAVPANATLVCTFDGLGTATGELHFFNLLLQNVKTTTAMKGWQRTLQQLDSLRTANRKWYDLLQTSSLSFQTSDGINPNNWSLCIALPENESALEFMQAWTPQLPKRDFKGVSLFVGATSSWCELRNCLIISPAAAVLEDVIIQSNKNNILSSDEAFIKAFNLRSKDVPLHISSRLSENDWITLEPVFTDDGTLLNGFLPVKQMQAAALCVSPGEMTIQNVLPENTTFLDVLHAPVFDSTWSTLADYYRGTPAETYWSQAWKDLGDSCQCDLNEIMLNWRSGEQGVAVIEIKDSLSESVSFIGIEDSSGIIDLIALAPFSTNQDKPADGIYATALPQIFLRNAMPTLSVENNFVMQLDGFLFSAASPAPLRSIQSNSKKLQTKNDFASFAKQASKSSGRFVYQSNNEVSLLPPSLSALLDGCGSRSITTEMSQPQQVLISISIPIRIKDSKPIQAPAALVPEKIEEKRAEPEQLDERTWTVINHNTREKETLRNNDKTLELIGSDGKSLWSMEISGPVLGDVVQIDALKNNKLQLAFTTQSAVYILDRNGKPLPGFPYNTKPPITSPLMVADYDNTKKYRLIFACGDGELFNIGVDGNATSGWRYSNTISEKIVALKTYKIASDDVIFAVSNEGSIQLLKRTGEKKTTCKSKLEGFDGKSLDIIAGSDFSSTSIVYSTGSSAKTIQLSVE